MAFVLRKEPSFKYPVNIHEPENGRKIVRKVDFSFLTISPDEVADLLLRSKEAQLSGEDSSFDRDLCVRVVKGWKSGDITDEQGAAIEFSDDMLLALIDIPYVRKAIVETYFEALNGGAKKGN